MPKLNLETLVLNSTYPSLNSTHGSTGEKTQRLLPSPADITPQGSAKKVQFSAPLSLNSEACIPRDAEE